MLQRLPLSLVRSMSSLVPPPNIQHLTLGGGTKLAYEKISSSASSGESGGSATVVYVPGFMSGKDGDKARHMRQFCVDNNLPYIRYCQCR